MNGQTVVHPHNGILASNKNEKTIDICNNTDESQRHCVQGKKPASEVYILSDSTDVTSERQNGRDGK